MSVLAHRTYCIKRTDKSGFFVLIIRAREEEAEASSLMYDGQTNALFIRRPKERILLDHIEPDLRGELLLTKRVGVVELDIITEDVTRTYDIPVFPVDQIFVATYGTATVMGEDYSTTAICRMFVFPLRANGMPAVMMISSPVLTIPMCFAV